MKIELTADWIGHKSGEVIEVDAFTASALRERGLGVPSIAKALDEPTRNKAVARTATRRKRGKRTAGR